LITQVYFWNSSSWAWLSK